MRKIVLTVFVFAVCAVTVAAENAIPNRMAKAKVGEWVLMEEVSGTEIGEKTRISVVKAGDGVVTIKREHMDANGLVSESKEHDIKLDEYNARMDKLKNRNATVTREFVVIKGKEFPVTAVQFISETKTEEGEEREFKIWFSEELPLGGVAKTWSSDPDFPSAEVIDYGF